MLITRSLCCAVAASLFAAPTLAQFNDQWLTLTDQTSSRLAGGPLSVSDVNTEIDFAFGDLDQDGDVDLVVARKQPFTTTGLRTNLLLMNVGGVLTDQSAQFASASDVVGDQGFLTPTNDRDIQVADLNGDGWLDVVTATTLSDGLPKAVGHPRIYINLGNDVSGNWLGLRYEEARIPQLLSYSTGLPENPRFVEVGVGDVTGDGSPDLYFGDQDGSGSGGAQQPAGKDLNDRLLVNDGAGFFTDQSQLRMTPAMLDSNLATSVAVRDVNGDGQSDIVKNSATFKSATVAVAYNDPHAVGMFGLLWEQSTGSPYRVNVGDLNNDGRLDLLVGDDGADYFRLNTGNDALGQALWSPKHTYDFLAGADDGFTGGIHVADLDGDGWQEVLVGDMDLDIASFFRRLHIYHNHGVAVGSSVPLLREERKSASDLDWVSAVGLHVDDLKGTYDTASFDINNDGKLDLVIGRGADTRVWMNGTPPPACGSVQFGLAASPANLLSLLPAGSSSVGTLLTLTTSGLKGFGTYNVASLAEANLAFLGGVALVDATQLALPISFTAGTAPTSVWSVQIPTTPGTAGTQVFFQSASMDPSQPLGWLLSNGVRLTVCP